MPPNAQRAALLLILLTCLAGCASTPQTSGLLEQAPDRSTTSALIPGLAFYPQDAWQCGPAALATLLSDTSLQVTPEELVPLVYVPDLKGSLQPEMIAAARSFERLVYPVPGTLEALLAEVDAGNPVLVLQNLGLSIYPKWHFAVVKGYDLAAGELVLNSGKTENYRLSLKTFERTWRRGDNWGFVALMPGELPANAEANAYFLALAPLLDRTSLQAGMAAIEAGLAQWPNDRNLLMSLGNHLYAAGEPVAAAVQFANVIKHDADYAPAYNNLAHIQTELGQYEAALGNITRALALDGEHQDSYRATHERLLGLMQP